MKKKTLFDYWYIIFVVECIYYLSYTLSKLNKFISISQLLTQIASILFFLTMVVAIIGVWILFVKKKITIKKMLYIVLMFNILSIILALPFILILSLNLNYFVFDIILAPLASNPLIFLFLLSAVFSYNNRR